MLFKLFSLITVSSFSLLLIFCMMNSMVLSSKMTVYFFSWVLGEQGSTSIEVMLIFDSLSMMFLTTVMAISSAVLIFSFSYMSQEKYYFRFHFLVLMFIGSMLMLILSPNLLSLLLGWDGLGLTSYLLVVYFNSTKALNAGLLTALSNRVGDCFILMSLALLLKEGGWTFYSWGPFNAKSMPFWVIGALSLAAMTKSAQVPFSAWLPAAMAAPTPVSALVHSSTLVTAGVYLLIRLNSLISSASWLNYLLLTGSMTMTLASMAALYEMDMKKIVALSTLSQLGFMVAALGSDLSNVAFFHLLTHAFFKALLFISVGSLIHLNKNYQDLRNLGNSEHSLPASLAFSLIANFSLMGMPFLAGFYSKDLILELILLSKLNFYILSLFFFAVSLTAVYSFRLISLISWNTKMGNSLKFTNDNSLVIGGASTILWLFAIMGGSALSWSLLETPQITPLPFFLKNCILILVMLGLMKGVQKNKLILLLDLKTWSWGNMWALPFSGTRTSSSFSLFYGNYPRKFLDLSWMPYLTLYPLFFIFNSFTMENYVTSKFLFTWSFMSVSFMWIWMIYLSILFS